MPVHAEMYAGTGPQQRSLFRPPSPKRETKEQRLTEAVDQLNLRYGRGTVRTATAGVRQGWRMRRDRLSPCYTTRLEDVPKVEL